MPFLLFLLRLTSGSTPLSLLDGQGRPSPPVRLPYALINCEITLEGQGRPSPPVLLALALWRIIKNAGRAGTPVLLSSVDRGLRIRLVGC